MRFINSVAFRLRLRCVPLLLLSVVWGCTSVRQDLHDALPKHMPASIDNFYHPAGLLSDEWCQFNHVQFFREFSLSDYRKVVVTVDTSAVEFPPKDDNTYHAFAQILPQFNDLFALGMRDEIGDLIPVEVFSASSMGDAKVLIARIRVTDFVAGSKAANFWTVGIAGNSQSHIEGDIVDAGTGQTLASFRYDNAADNAWIISYDERLRAIARYGGNCVGMLIEAFYSPAGSK